MFTFSDSISLNETNLVETGKRYNSALTTVVLKHTADFILGNVDIESGWGDSNTDQQLIWVSRKQGLFGGTVFSGMGDSASDRAARCIILFDNPCNSRNTISHCLAKQSVTLRLEMDPVLREDIVRTR